MNDQDICRRVASCSVSSWGYLQPRYLMLLWMLANLMA